MADLSRVRKRIIYSIAALGVIDAAALVYLAIPLRAGVEASSHAAAIRRSTTVPRKPWCFSISPSFNERIALQRDGGHRPFDLP